MFALTVQLPLGIYVIYNGEKSSRDKNVHEPLKEITGEMTS
jgi:hypothetical protein